MKQCQVYALVSWDMPIHDAESGAKSRQQQTVWGKTVAVAVDSVRSGRLSAV